MRAFLALTAVMVWLGAGCATTKRQTVEQSPAICGFVGQDVCAALKPGAEGEGGLRYVNPKGMFTQYDKVTIVVVGFFGSDPGKVQSKDEQQLTDLFYKELQEALAKRYQVVDEAGPGVMKVEVALLDAEAATPGVRSVTMVIPQLRLLSAGYALVAGRYPFSGGGLAAAKISDSMTEQTPRSWRGSPGRGRGDPDGGPVAVGGRRERDQGLVLATRRRYVCIHLGREKAMRDAVRPRPGSACGWP